MINIDDFNKITKWAKENDALEIANMSIDYINNIRELNLSNLDIIDIPIEFFKLINLDRLYLSLNYIEKIPRDIGNLKNLKILDISANNIKHLPKEIFYL